jgi:nucleotide-binding universal stress UspA family protein
MYRMVIVPLDGSPFAEVALTHLPHVAGMDTDVLLLRVIDPIAAPIPIGVPSSPGVGMGGVGMGPVALMTSMPPSEAALAAAEKERQDAEVYLAGLASDRRGQVGHVRTMVLRDADPAAIIASQARAEQADLIVMATHGRSGVVRWVLGSVADKLLRTATTPLLLVRPGEPTV